MNVLYYPVSRCGSALWLISYWFCYGSILVQLTRVALQEDRNNTVTIGVADEHVGLVLGRNGRSIMEISQVCKEVVILPGMHMC